MGAVVYTYDGDGCVVSESRSSVTSLYESGNDGSTLGLVNSSGSLVDQLSYSAFGVQLSETGSSATPFKWLGGTGIYGTGSGGSVFTQPWTSGPVWDPVTGGSFPLPGWDIGFPVFGPSGSLPVGGGIVTIPPLCFFCGFGILPPMVGYPPMDLPPGPRPPSPVPPSVSSPPKRSPKPTHGPTRPIYGPIPQPGKSGVDSLGLALCLLGCAVDQAGSSVTEPVNTLYKFGRGIYTLITGKDPGGRDDLIPPLSPKPEPFIPWFPKAPEGAGGDGEESIPKKVWDKCKEGYNATHELVNNVKKFADPAACITNCYFKYQNDSNDPSTEPWQYCRNDDDCGDCCWKYSNYQNILDICYSSCIEVGKD